ncbi:hypothetical protein C5C41_07705 [Rathayibacter sp. AY1E9]|uniref:hypothetical protein n=1 Tax=Rathayibacter sp. AY1E9 TaxID=2080556 RepID=UPI000CE817FB|nr:hypothetical protein [Rathayibacter sp. AY1E9]PPG53106.1 hypothetical protein C5C41_07705 [Rathayibacter sp. AY1E9]
MTSSLRAILFGFLGDVGSKLGISVVALTNRPDRLDDAARDRLTTLPVLHPTPSELAAIMAIQARRDNIAFNTDEARTVLNDTNAVFSGRQAVRLLGRAHIHAARDGRDNIAP